MGRPANNRWHFATGRLTRGEPVSSSGSGAKLQVLGGRHEKSRPVEMSRAPTSAAGALDEGTRSCPHWWKKVFYSAAILR